MHSTASPTFPKCSSPTLSRQETPRGASGPPATRVPVVAASDKMRINEEEMLTMVTKGGKLLRGFKCIGLDMW